MAMRRRRSPEISVEEQEAFRKRVTEYWRQVQKSDGFDIDHLRSPYFEGLKVCKDKKKFSVLIRLYGRMGLHRYNMLQGTNLQLLRIVKYNRRCRQSLPSGYYITLLAHDPSTPAASPITFQTCILETSMNQFWHKCYVARPKGQTTLRTLSDDPKPPQFLDVTPPKWPSDDAFANKTLFYELKESEWQENDWIRLYLELAHTATYWHRHKPKPKLTDLTIANVVIQTETKVNSSNELLKALTNAVIYIKYHQDLGDGQVQNRRAIIKRRVDLRTGHMCLRGDDFLDGASPNVVG